MFSLRSPAFENGDTIPVIYVEDSLISPPLQWENPPVGTEAFFLILLDQDIPGLFRDNLKRGFVHWIACIPSSLTGLPEGASPGKMPNGSVEFGTDFQTFSIPGYDRHYGGPWPPDSQHRYSFLLFALKNKPDLSPDADFNEIANILLFNTIDVATLIGVYGPAKKPLPQ